MPGLYKLDLSHPVRRKRNPQGLGLGILELRGDSSGDRSPVPRSWKTGLGACKCRYPKRHIWLSKFFDENQPVHASGICWLALWQPTCPPSQEMKFPAEPSQMWGSCRRGGGGGAQSTRRRALAETSEVWPGSRAQSRQSPGSSAKLGEVAECKVWWPAREGTQAWVAARTGHNGVLKATGYFSSSRPLLPWFLLHQ